MPGRSGAMRISRQFAVTPELDDVERLDRLIAFHPARTAAPETLSPRQIDAYNANGYLSGLRIFSDAEIRDIRSRFDKLLAEVTAAGGDSYSISSAHLRHADAYDLLTDRRIVAHVGDLLGENVIGWGAHYFCKMPGDGKSVSWHQDAVYWPLTPAHTATVWLAIDDADAENACMRFIPASHLRGRIAFEKSAAEESNVLNLTVPGVDRFGAPVDNVLRAGEISLHSDLLLHGSEANRSERRRCGLTLRYCSASVRAYLDWNLKGVVVRGSDPDGHWANPARPGG